MPFVRSLIAKRARTLAAPRRGGGLGPLSYEKRHKSPPRDPSRPAPEALLLVYLAASQKGVEGVKINIFLPVLRGCSPEIDPGPP